MRNENNVVLWFWASVATFGLFVVCMELTIAKERLRGVDRIINDAAKSVVACEKKIDICDARVASKLDHIINVLKEGL